MAEKEIVLDLSGKIMFSKTTYISLGTFILSTLLVIILIINVLCANGWVFSGEIFVPIIAYLTALRSGEFEDEKIDK